MHSICTAHTAYTAYSAFTAETPQTVMTSRAPVSLKEDQIGERILKLYEVNQLEDHLSDCSLYWQSILFASILFDHQVYYTHCCTTKVEQQICRQGIFD